jgi:hypothetical protein
MCESGAGEKIFLNFVYSVFSYVTAADLIGVGGLFTN